MPHENDYEETYLREQIARLQREYHAAIKPYVDQLVYIESLRTRPSFPVYLEELSPEQRKRLDELCNVATPE